MALNRNQILAAKQLNAESFLLQHGWNQSNLEAFCDTTSTLEDYIEGLEREVDSIKKAPEAKSRCTCGHTGDGRMSDHATEIAPGHGACLVPGCTCRKFSWASFMPKR